MPQVPRYEQQTVGLNPIATPQARPLGAAAFGAGIGQGLQDVASAGFKVAAIQNHLAEVEKDKMDKSAVADAQDQLITGYNRTIQDASQVKGIGVTAGYDETGKPQEGAPDLYTQKNSEFNEWRQEIEKTLSPDQRMLFKPEAEKYSSEVEKQLLDHQLKETDLLHKERFAALGEKQIDQLIASPDETSFKAGLAPLRDTMENLLQGHSPEFISNAYDKKIAAIQTDRVKNAISRGDSITARVIFDSAGLDPKSSEYADLSHRLDGAEAGDKGTSYVSSIWVEPKNNAPVLNSAELFNGIDEAVKKKQLTPEAARVAEADLSQKLSRYEHQRSANIHLYKSDLWQKIDDNVYNLKSALASIDAAPIDGDERVRLKKDVERHFKPPADPELKMMQQREQDSELADLMDKISNGEIRIKNLKEAQGYAGKIGRGNVDRLYRYGTNYEKVLAAPVMAPTQFKNEIKSLRESGIDVPKDKSADYGAMQSYVLDELVQRQVKTGKILSADEQKKEIRKIVTEKIPVYMTSSVPFSSSLHIEEKAPWQVQNSAAVDVVGMLTKSLKRPPTAKEIADAQAALNRPRANRQQMKIRAGLGGND